MFVEECKYIVEEKQMPEYITDDIEISDEEILIKNDENFNEENEV